MSSAGFRIKQQFARPERELIEAFRGIPTSNIADCMNRAACVDAAIIPFNKTPLLGCAFTVSAPGGDNLLFHKALDMALPGDILVIAGGGCAGRSCCGEIMVRYAMAKQLGGFVVDGCIRDAEAIARLPFPVYARGVTPDGPFKNGPGEIGFPVSFAGRVICPGDILVGDGDGVVVVTADEAREISKEAKEVVLKEKQMLADLLRMDRSWIDQTLEAKGCRYV
ncbi:MAG: RraA family protein [Desulfovibrio sp.]|jgi:regulator of RNase E activity RraA|nr:RraA family protein [Desulfovibrio sp.]